jgi:hypothetical protein
MADADTHTNMVQMGHFISAAQLSAQVNTRRIKLNKQSWLSVEWKAGTLEPKGFSQELSISENKHYLWYGPTDV